MSQTPERHEEAIDIPTRETANFLASHLVSPAVLLEVGAGHGHVALELSRRGYRVLGVEADQGAVDQARAHQAPVVLATWPDFFGASVDAVAFTRSLHHIGPLDQAVGKARGLLRPGGKLLVEDFASDEVNDVTLNWFREILGSRFAPALLAEPGRIRGGPYSLARPARNLAPASRPRSSYDQRDDESHQRVFRRVR